MAIDIIARGMAANAEGGGGSTAWSDITGKPSTFPPSSHTHTASDITNLDEAIASSSAVSGIEDEVAALSSAVEDMEDMVVIADTSTAGLVKPDGTTITVGQDGTITAVGGSDDDVFIATYSTTTKAELDAAYQAGKTIFVEYDNGTTIEYLPLTQFYDTQGASYTRYYFAGNISARRLRVIHMMGSGVWGIDSPNTLEAMDYKERDAIVNPTSTTYYPSSKAVVSYVASQLPDVATTSAAGIVQPDGTSITVNNGVISATGGAANITSGTTDLQDGVSPLATGTLYCYYTE